MAVSSALIEIIAKAPTTTIVATTPVFVLSDCVTMLDALARTSSRSHVLERERVREPRITGRDQIDLLRSPHGARAKHTQHADQA
jgi:hypothetical protein